MHLSIRFGGFDLSMGSGARDERPTEDDDEDDPEFEDLTSDYPLGFQRNPDPEEEDDEE